MEAIMADEEKEYKKYKLTADDKEFLECFEGAPKFSDFSDIIVSHDPKGAKEMWKNLRALFKKFGTLNYPRLVEYGHLKIAKYDSNELINLSCAKERDDRWYLVFLYGQLKAGEKLNGLGLKIKIG